MTEGFLQREYLATAGAIRIRLTHEFEDDVPTRHLVEVRFGTPGKPFSHSEDAEFPADSDGFARALAKFNQAVRSVL